MIGLRPSASESACAGKSGTLRRVNGGWRIVDGSEEGHKTAIDMVALNMLLQSLHSNKITML